MDIFKDEQDYNNFQKRLDIVLGHTKPRLNYGGPGMERIQIKSLDKGSFDLVAYCLMPNHYHFLIKQNGDVPISTFISKLFTSYSMYFNKKYNRVGTLFQDIFKSVLVDDNEQLLWLSAYIHQNPVVAGVTWDLNQWKWSSYGQYLGGEGVSNPGIILEQFKDLKGYQKFVDSSFDLIVKKKQSDKDIFLD